MNAPAYPKTKKSGVEWLGDIPEHWEVRRLKFAAPLINDKVDASDSGLPYMGLEHIESWTGRRIPDADAASDGIATQFIPGDVLFGKLRPYLAKVYLADREGVASTELLVLRSEEDVCPEFLRYYTVSRDFINAVDSSTYGAKMPRANWELIGNLPSLIPSLDEQHSIAEFLDRKTGRIDELIGKKKELIGKLNEQRSALITHAVTKGLDVSVPMKDSGVAWLGKVPKHWSVKKFAYISNVVRGASPRPAGDPRFFNGDSIPWITVGELTKDSSVYLESTATMLTEEGAAQSRGFVNGTLILTNSGATLGVPKILKLSGCANDGVVAFENLEASCEKRYLYYYLTSLTLSLRERTKQGGQPNLNTDIVKSLSVPCPAFDEQQAIAEYLDEKTGKIDGLIQKTQTAIQTLEEYRTALITAAVTGKVKVA